MSDKPILHGANASPFVRKVRVALAEKGIEYEPVQVMPMGQTAEYLAMSPLGKIPCYQEGEFTLPDSSVILAYLERKQPQPALLPQDAKQAGRALWYEEYADSKLAEVFGGLFFNRVLKAKILKQEADAAAVEKCLKGLPAVFDYLSQEIGDREWLAGPQFSVADIAVGSFFVNLMHAGETVDASRWPQLAAYVERVHGRPSFKSIVEAEKAQFASL
jgi:glutathione S-transferase